MNCEEFRRLKDQYLKGETTQEQDKLMEAHLEQCPPCRQMLDKIMSVKEADTKGDIHLEPALDEKKQRKILRWAKYKNRFSMAVFLLFLFMISLLICMLAGTFLSGHYYTWGEENSRLYKTQLTAALLTEYTMPNLAMEIDSPFPFTILQGSMGKSSFQIKPYFVVQGSYALEKEIGREKKTVGYLEIDHLFSRLLPRWNWHNGTYPYYLFFTYPVPGTENLPESDQTTWEALEMLPEGTVAEMALSFNNLLETRQVIDLLSDYDLSILWYAVATGVEEENSSRSTYRETLSLSDGVIGFAHDSDLLSWKDREAVNQSDGELRFWFLNLFPFKFQKTVYVYSTDYNDSAVKERYFMDGLAYLVKNSDIVSKIYRGNLKKLQLEKRYQYLQENGVKVYGVVVTGPTKELLKLKDLKEITSPALGEVTLWNWFGRPFQSTLY